MFALLMTICSTLHANDPSPSSQGEKALQEDLKRWEGSWQMILRERDGELSEIGTIIITFSTARGRTSGQDDRRWCFGRIRRSNDQAQCFTKGVRFQDHGRF